MNMKILLEDKLFIDADVNEEMIKKLMWRFVTDIDFIGRSSKK